MFARSHIRAQILGRARALVAAHGFCTLALAATAGLTACGQKGPLFFPPPPKALPTAGVTPVTPASTLGALVEAPNIPQPPPAAPPTSAPR
ncbi:LPS translocon maturation chaperone LptM [Polaromonas eurypsychrophila]|uniref:LPS translocon maturation chaperone LptM n=1 Tax=Polaromonas eurypsychrophila TaxID=1614635 RepID=UPI00166D8999|nr:lipoprotein [Polaromonas eurypsychrophila]